jgi:AcrR family transcriptional regulator
MARTLDPVAHAVRRDAFLDAAQRLIQSKGYEQMSLQDVLDEIAVSKGAFYHYFESKEALLAAVVDRMVEAGVATMEITATDPNLSALQQLAGMFATLTQFKTERKDFLLELMKVWFHDDNAIVLQKMWQGTSVLLTPLLAGIVRRGNTQGTFTVTSPEGTARVLMSFLRGLNNEAGHLFLARQENAVSLDEVERTFASYWEAFERILGLPSGSWKIVDDDVIKAWFG